VIRINHNRILTEVNFKRSTSILSHLNNVIVFKLKFYAFNRSGDSKLRNLGTL
jgi:hypothetical protein